MILDIIFVILLVVAMVKGYQRGLIVGVFSFVAIIVGLAAAIKLSSVVANYIGKTVKISEQWLPLIAFAVIFLVVVLLVRAAAAMIEKSVQLVMLGWLNRLGGMVFYIALYVTIFSVVLFYAEHMRLIQPVTIHKSLTYPFVQPWGPKAINSFATIIPFFKNMFKDLESFFGNLSQGMS